MNVLSIDFDYFQKMDAFTAYTYFPAPNDFSVEAALNKWGLIYLKPNVVKYLDKIDIMQSEYDKVKHTLKNLGNINSNIPVNIVNSHGELYGFVKTNCKNKEEPINVINIDMHHDVYGTDEDELSCANWATCLKLNYTNLKNIWVKNTVNSEDYDTFMGNKNEKRLDEETTNLDIIDNYAFDLIFLCRSDAFVLPRLDNYFVDLCSVLDLKFNNIKLENNINKPRDLQGKINQLLEVYNA